MSDWSLIGESTDYVDVTDIPKPQPEPRPEPEPEPKPSVEVVTEPKPSVEVVTETYEAGGKGYSVWFEGSAQVPPQEINVNIPTPKIEVNVPTPEVHTTVEGQDSVQESTESETAESETAERTSVFEKIPWWVWVVLILSLVFGFYTASRSRRSEMVMEEVRTL